MRMRASEYVRKWRWIIIAFCVIATIATYVVLDSRQTYTASVVIEYTNPSADQLYNVDGTKIDPTEIYAAKTVAKAISAMGSDASVDSIRSNITVTELIPADEQSKIDAALDNGSTYTYNPTQYTVSYVSKVSQQDARKVLSQVLSAYFEDYGEMHVATVTLPANSASLVKSDYDYLENAEITQSAVNDMLGYLKTQETSYPDWRSALTGYSFSDLYSEYKNLSDSRISALFATILQNKSTRDYDLLVKRYTERIAADTLKQENDQERMDSLQQLIDNYTATVDKGTNENLSGDSTGSTTTTTTTDVVLQNVYDEGTDTTTQYDAMMQEYVTVAEEHDTLQTDIDYCQKILDTYAEDEVNTSDDEAEALQQSTTDTVAALYDLVQTSYSEFNRYLGAANIGTVSSVTVADGFNIKLLMAIAIVLFLIFGCLGAMAVGQVFNLVHRLAYIDDKTELDNRLSADNYISELAKKSDSTVAVISIHMRNLQEVNNSLGRTTGDALLKLYGKAIKDAMGKGAFANYNGAGRFFIFLPDASFERAQTVADFIRTSLRDNTQQLPIDYTYGIAQTEHDGEPSVRKLIVKASDIEQGVSYNTTAAGEQEASHE